MTDTIIDGTRINTDVFSYSAPKSHASGGKVVNLYNKHTRESLTIAAPMLLTWGAQESKDKQGTPLGKWTMSLQFPSAEYPNEDGESFLNSMRELETKIKTDAMTYSKDWFGKNITSSDVMDEKFNVMLRHPKIKGTEQPDTSKAPTVTVKLPCWSGVWKSEIYDEDREPLYINGKTNSHLTPLEFLKPKSRVICLIQCGGLWFVNGKVSITWNLKQAIVQKPKQSMEGTCMLMPKEADKQFLKNMEEPVELESKDNTISATVDDSDDEEEEEEEEAVVEEEAVEEEVVQPPAPPVVEEPLKKKRVVKKKAVV